MRQPTYFLFRVAGLLFGLPAELIHGVSDDASDAFDLAWFFFADGHATRPPFVIAKSQDRLLALAVEAVVGPRLVQFVRQRETVRYVTTRAGNAVIEGVSPVGDEIAFLIDLDRLAAAAQDRLTPGGR